MSYRTTECMRLHKDIHEWKLPLLTSLLEIRDDRWGPQFDEETGQLGEDEVTHMINNVCIN